MSVSELSSDILCTIISGGRPLSRPTEALKINGYKCIISNNSEGYNTDIDIINVPNDFREYYKRHHALTDFGMKVPMSRSYALKYAREQGYKYIVQMDDNIMTVHYVPVKKSDRETRRIKLTDITPVINLMHDVLELTNAGMCGMKLNCFSSPNTIRIGIGEGYPYSFFMLQTADTPYFFGDVEEDIAMRLQLARMKIPCAMLRNYMYGKVGQISTGDKSGNRKMYDEMGFERGKYMRKFFGEFYQAGKTNRKKNTNIDTFNFEIFAHKLKQFTVGLRTNDTKRLNSVMIETHNEIVGNSERVPGRNHYIYPKQGNKAVLLPQNN